MGKVGCFWERFWGFYGILAEPVLAKSERNYFEKEKLQRQMRKKSGAKI